VVIAYLLGAIPTSVWIGKMFYRIDVRDHGSGNAGATNTIRVLGYKAGVPVLIFDVLKGWLAVYSANFYPYTWEAPGFTEFRITLALAAVIGHVYPIYVGFRGGKGIATLLGVGFGLFPVAALIALGVFLIVVAATKYVSLGSMIAAVTFPFTELVVLGHHDSIPVVILSFIIAIFVPLTHRKNIARLIRGEESKLSFRKKS
ncbi:MAG: glycerol-3-phosphate 1-O-acyltransferase PlsY, partial [Bacteroidales bacterium]